MSAKKRIVVTAAAFDLTALMLFAVLGRRAHDSGDGIGAVLTIAAPFAIGYVIAAAIMRLDRAPLALPRAALAGVLAAVFGLALRRFVFDRGTAPAFIAVAVITITLLLVAWRAIAGIVRRRAAAAG